MGHSLRRRVAATLLPFVASAGLVSCAADDEASSPTVEHLVPQIVATHPFDDSSFTQGLEVDEDGTLLVGTGWEGQSRLYRTNLEGEELASVDLDPSWFGEGVTRHDDHIWQLTWQEQIALKRDATTLEEMERVTYPGEGWGICSTGTELIMSDGTSQLRRLDPDTFAERERFEVTLEGTAVEALNELECVDGDVYANIFLDTAIVRIDARPGETAGTVTGVIDGAVLPNNALPDPNHVLNGIAHLPGTDRFLLTGKRWPDLYEVELVPAG
ncbi:glutaminyl-peptide cyclotransferase [Corynebacterium sp.]|uniref:glutaminyl-peptide cyclotransferase n=1 Tax=Corynebacterium sp. TaxID=1720 RepID=UPI0026E0473B|nr:glutaminyl-peptide cyclotransferase [Corynebacterium sp.]MDO5512452.1 glutaminyl-peptide cyclotransferase [Corynebacterium sp.]